MNITFYKDTPVKFSNFLIYSWAYKRVLHQHFKSKNITYNQLCEGVEDALKKDEMFHSGLLIKKTAFHLMRQVRDYYKFLDLTINDMDASIPAEELSRRSAARHKKLIAKYAV